MNLVRYQLEKTPDGPMTRKKRQAAAKKLGPSQDTELAKTDPQVCIPPSARKGSNMRASQAT